MKLDRYVDIAVGITVVLGIILAAYIYYGCQQESRRESERRTAFCIEAAKIYFRGENACTRSSVYGAVIRYCAWE